MGKSARLAERARREKSRPTARPIPVVVEAGYPALGWREELAALDVRRAKIERRQVELVAQALAAGASFSEIARALGKSRQAVHSQYRRLRPTVAQQGRGRELAPARPDRFRNNAGITEASAETRCQ